MRFITVKGDRLEPSLKSRSADLAVSLELGPFDNSRCTVPVYVVRDIIEY